MVKNVIPTHNTAKKLVADLKSGVTKIEGQAEAALSSLSEEMERNKLAINTFAQRIEGWQRSQTEDLLSFQKDTRTAQKNLRTELELQVKDARNDLENRLEQYQQRLVDFGSRVDEVEGFIVARLSEQSVELRRSLTEIEESSTVEREEAARRVELMSTELQSHAAQSSRYSGKFKVLGASSVLAGFYWWLRLA